MRHPPKWPIVTSYCFTLLRSHWLPTISPQPTSPTMARAKCYNTLDAYCRLIALLVRHSGDASNNVTKINLLSRVSCRQIPWTRTPIYRRDGNWAELTFAKTSGTVTTDSQKLTGASPVTIPESIAWRISVRIPFSFVKWRMDALKYSKCTYINVVELIYIFRQRWKMNLAYRRD